MQTKILYCFFLFSFCTAYTAKAQKEPVFIDALFGDSIKVGKKMIVKDSADYDVVLRSTIKNTYSINNIISLRIIEESNKVLPDSFQLSVRVKISYSAPDTATSDTLQKTLTINYSKNKPYNNKAIFLFTTAHYVEVEILQVSSLFADTSVVRPLVMMENRMVIQRDYTMNCTNDAIQGITQDATTVNSFGELRLSWLPNGVSQMYDVEWAYLDQSAINNGRYDISGHINPDLIFKNNATRITTKADTCMIPLFYDGEGSLFYRIRGVQIDQYGEVQTTNWSSQADTATAHWKYHYMGHERGLNWQATTTYAEEGKRKSVVQYFDGSLRGRQVVTRDNTTKTTVVAETLYDKQGRPVIQVMPAPTLNTLIHYTPYFNVKNMNGEEYDKSVYDTLFTNADYCGIHTDSMSVVSGASQYYSSNNPLQNQGFHQFIPNANGYAFTQTQYTQDNTGRIFRQGGVDTTFKLGSRKETKYYYGTPDQSDLDALFGTEVGDASNYQKNMVRDANGQYSVSYVDMHGRTIATALAGTSPGSLQQLNSIRDSVQTEQLLTKTNNIVNGNSVEFSKTIFMTRKDSVWFHYNMGTQGLSLKDCKDSNICYSCLYDLKLTITGDCSSQVSGQDSKIVTLSNFPLWRVDTTCGLAIPIDTTIAVQLEEGTYNITKTLSISQNGMNQTRDSVYLPHNTCKDYTYFFHHQMQMIKDSLNCSVDTLSNSSYLHYREQMLLDMYPLLGQYGNTDSARTCFSIFDKIGDKYYYQTDTSICYKNEVGTCDFVSDGMGNLVAPQNLTPQEFIANFKPSWAEKLLPLHPEYPLLVEYEKLKDSHIYDEDFENTDTYAIAVAKGYLNPTSSSQSPASRFYGSSHDPLYDYAFGNTAKAYMEDSLFHFYNDGSNNLTLWGFATAMTKCGEPINSTCAIKWNNNSNVFNTDSLCTGELDMAWRIFRSVYLQKKKDWEYQYIHSVAASPYPYPPCTPIFTNKETVLAMNGFSAGNLGQDTIIAKDSSLAFYTANCNAYKDRWKQQLSSSCYSDVQKDSIISVLINVCKEGADQDHPFGASTVRPASTYIYQSFASVFNHYNSIWNITNPICNAYLIDKPLPYNQPIFVTQQQVWGKPDSCTCSKINTLYSQYQFNSSGYSSFSDYIQQTLQTTISNSALDSLRNLCSGNITCKFIPSPITIPPALQCGASNTCTNCIQFKDAYNNFVSMFPTVTPTIAEPDTIQQLNNRLFANYMNDVLGFTKTAQEYLTFKQQCDTFSIPTGTPDTSFTCTNFLKLVNGFKNYYANLTSGNPNSEPPQVYDSNGCNVTHWTLNQGGYIHDKKYKFLDFLDSGILRQPLNDTTSTHINYNYNGSFCVNDGFSLAVRLKFPIDSARRAMCLRNGGSGLYGNVVFELFTNINDIYQEKIYGQFGPNYAWPYPNYIHYNNIPIGLPMETHKWGDSNLLANLNSWRIFKITHKNGKVKLYLDSTLLETIDNPSPVFTAGPFAFASLGYDLRIDWVKLYDENDSLRTMEDFEDCSFNRLGVGANCNTDCQKLFTRYVNYYMGRNLTSQQILDTVKSCGITIDPCGYTGPILCGKNEPMNEFVNIQPNPCADSTNLAIIGATQLNQIYQDSLIGNFNESYTKKCLNVSSLESFTVTKPVSEYHYTLYYYDQAGNLVKTVPPAGVHPNRDATWLAQVKAKRENADWQAPGHTLPTVYRYNSLNQVVTQQSPDGGLSKFWYDRLGRLAISQNAKQNAVNKYSYTLYDAIGRIIEVGEKLQPQGISQTITRDETALKKWIEFGDTNPDYCPQMVTATHYDDISDFNAMHNGLTPFTQKAYTLRNRVSWTRYLDGVWVSSNISGTDTSYTPHYTYFNTGIEYSYDIHGNVDSMLNEAYWGSVMTDHGGNSFKLITYKYDLISGKVLEVHYQPSNSVKTYADEFYHRYEYDADNRLTDVYTTDNKAFLGQSGLEEHDAHYQYYKHGPLARVVLGHQQVQGIDYAYTLQGWLKGVNSTSLNPDFDMGQDGKIGSLNGNVARDAFGFNLNYFTGEYAQINQAVNNPFPGHTGFMPSGTYKPLYNGNISSMAVSIGKFAQPQLYNYGYDQLNRIISMDVYRGLDSTNSNWNSLAGVNDYKERIAYDANGNIQKYLRNGYGSTLAMDSLNYSYLPNTNKLDHVSDNVPASNYTEDIDNQSAGNYQYDSIGNMISDVANDVNSIDWNVYGKITHITRALHSYGDISSIKYTYDPNGNRVGKDFWYYGGDHWADFHWYVRDAQGNIMAVYKTSMLTTYGSYGPLKLTEHDVYGSSRLGTIQRDLDMDSAKVDPVHQNLIGDTYLYTQQRGLRNYELSNHLGNVLVNVSDKKFGHVNGSTYDYYSADVVNANDYYPFGMMMPNRKFSASNLYRYGFNGKENDNEVKGEGNEQSYGFRVYDPRVAKFLSIDPLQTKFPWNSPYSYAEGDVIRSIDLDGLERYVVTYWYDNKGNHRTTTIKAIRAQDSKEAMDMNFYSANAGDLTSKDVWVRKLYLEDGRQKENATGKGVLNASEKALFGKAVTIRDRKNDEIFYDLRDEKGGASTQSEKFDNKKYEFREATQNIPLIHDLKQSLDNANSFFWVDKNGNGQMFSRSEASVAAGGSKDLLKLYDLPSSIKEDGKIKSVDITINIAFSTDLNNKEFAAIQQGLNNVGDQLKVMYQKNSGVQNVIVHINAERTKDFHKVNASTPGVQITLKR